AAIPGVTYRRTPGPGRDPHSLNELTPLPPGAMETACDPYQSPEMMAADTRTIVCPVRSHPVGGPGFIYHPALNRLQAREIATRLVRGAGHHVIKFGVDFEYPQYSSNRGYTGNRLYREEANGSGFADLRQYAFLSAPDEANVLPNLQWGVQSTTIGGFIQDSWSIMDRVTLNAGLRYDAQHLFSGDKSLAMALPNQFSPRVGLIWDPTYAGKAKLFVNYARFYQSVPLNLADRAGSGEPGLQSLHSAAPGACTDPLAPGANDPDGACQIDAHRLIIGGPLDPDQRWSLASAGKTPIDPKLKPQSSDEIVAGAEYEIIPDTRLGLHYTHRWLNKVIEDMSRDEAATYFIGNPGYGIAKDFPK